MKKTIRNMIRTCELLTRKNVRSNLNYQQKASQTYLLVHIGNSAIPEYIKDTIEQICLFNNCQIVLACSKKNREKVKQFQGKINVVYLEDVKASKKHIRFSKKQTMKGFPYYTTERFFVIEEIMMALDLENVVHVENDNLIYGDAHKVYGLLSTNNERMVVTRHNNKQCIGGIIFIPSIMAIKRYTDFLIEEHLSKYINDMDSLSLFANKYGVDYAPVITREYTSNFPLISKEGDAFDDEYDESVFSGSIRLDYLFDAASLGQYVGGIDKIHDSGDTRGYINTNCLYDPSLMPITWEKENDMFVPYIYDHSSKYKVLNLHIHSKELYKYRSDNQELLSNIKKC